MALKRKCKSGELRSNYFKLEEEMDDENVEEPEHINENLESMDLCKPISEKYRYATYTEHSYKSSHQNFELKDMKKNTKTLQGSRQKNLAKHYIYCYLLISAVIILALSILWKIYFPKNQNIDVKKEVMLLKKKFPNQNKILWQNVLKIMNSSTTEVQTLILVYKSINKDSYVVAECLARYLGQIINKKHNEGSDLSIYEHKKEIIDYGKQLEFYRNIVRNTKHLLIFNLHKIPGETARFFHFLCDEITSDIKPSYFIFTMQDSSEEGKNNNQLLYLQRAGDILRNVWHDLLDNELTPLIVRIVRNVVEVLPENMNDCY